MNRLPGFDTDTIRTERWTFLSLSLAAIALIAVALYDASRFAVTRDEITTPILSGALSVAGRDTNAAAKKLPTIQPKAQEESAGVNAVLDSKS